MNNYVKLGVGALVAIMLFIGWFMLFDIVVIGGSQVGVKETWSSGVLPTPLPSRTYFIYPWERMHVYDVGVNVFEMSDREKVNDSYLVQSSDSQDMHLSLQTQWRIDPEHVVNLHKTVGAKGIEERVLRPTLLRVVKNKATTKKAIEAYSGDGLVQLQTEIETELNAPDGDLAARGVIVDSFVIEHIKLDADYVKEIAATQVAIQKERRATQEEKAEQAVALKAKASAQADLNKAVVEAERDKQVAVLKAEADAEKSILAAEAEKKKTVLAAEAKKESGELEAASILALGKANAESEKLKYSAYETPGAEVYARIQVANALGQAFGNIKGYIPENMTIYTLGDSFTKAVENIVKAPQK